VSTVARRLKRLRQLGMIDWTRQYRERDTGHGIERRQETNAYRFYPPEQSCGHRAGPRLATVI